jgi:hypothetical protein
MTLQCLQSVGCKSSVLYTQLEKECKHACPFSDPRSKEQESVCYSDFNSGFRLFSSQHQRQSIWIMGTLTAFVGMIMFLWE